MAFGAALLLLLFELQSTALLAQQKSSSADYLKSMIDSLEARGGIGFKFNMSTLGSDGSVVGSISGDVKGVGSAFTLTTPLLEIFCDGKTKWIYNVGEGEVIILNHDSSQIDFIENPIGFLAALGRGEAPFVPTQNRGGKSKVECGRMWWVELTPKRRGSPYKSLTICIDRESSLPKILMLKNLDESSYNIEIEAFNEISNDNPTLYKFPQERIKNLKINDLR